MRLVKKGAASQTIYLEVLDSTSITGARKTGLVFNTSGLTAYYVRNGGSAAQITLAALAAANSAWSSGGFKEVDATNMPGVYRLDVPDAAFAGGAESVVVTLRGATGMVQVSEEVQLVAVDLQDGVRLGLTALPNAAAEAAGGLYTRGSGAGQINQPANGIVDANVVRNAGTAITAASGVQEVKVQSIANDALTAAAIAADAIGSSELAATAASEIAGAVRTELTTELGRVDVAVSSRSSHSVADIWNALVSGITTANSIGKRIIDFLTGDVFARLGAPAGASVSADVASLQSDTTNIKNRLPAELTVNGNIKSSLREIVSGALVDPGGEIAEAFEHFFQVASPTGTVNSLPDAAPGAAGGLLVDDVWTDERAAKLDNLDTAVSSRGTGTALDAAGVRTAVGLAAADLDDQLEAVVNASGGAPTIGEISSTVRATLFTDRFGGTPAASNIVFADAGGASIEGLGLYKSVSGGAPTIDTAVKPSGAYSSIKCDIAQWVRAACLGSGKISVYFFTESLPTANETFLLPEDDSGSPDPVMDIRIGPDGLVYLHPVDASPEIAGTHPISAGWNRISVCFNNHNTINNLDARVYVNGMLDIAVDGQGTNDITAGQVRLPGPTIDGGPFYFAHVVVEDGADLLDPGNRLCTAKFPATVNEDEFDTTGGTGAVNERPPDDANYRQQAASTLARQNYTLQAAGEGDVDITGMDVVGFMGWIRGGKSTPFGGGAPKITVDGVDYNLTLTTTASYVTKPVTRSGYPSNPAGIGMVSTGSSVDVTLFECGVVVVYTPPFVPTKEAIADTVWDENVGTEHQTAGSAGNKLNQALVLYEGD